MDLLRIESLCKTYGKGDNEVKALDNVSFTVPKGQMCAVIGASGSGKSTLLHIIGAVDTPTSGKVFLEDQDVFSQNNTNLAIFRRRQVGMIYQFYNLIPVLNAEENITLPMIMDGRKPDKAHLEKLLELLGLKERRRTAAESIYRTGAVYLTGSYTCGRAYGKPRQQEQRGDHGAPEKVEP